MRHRDDVRNGNMTCGETLRAFFAIDLDARIREAAMEVARDLRACANGDAVRWVRGESLHVTLRFLGEIDGKQVEPLLRCVQEKIAALQPFRLELGAARPFPSRRRPVAIVLDVGPEQPLRELAAAVDEGAVAVGFEPESRPFRGHLTLGRVPGNRFPAVTASVTAVGESFAVEEAVLVKSELHRSGARYTPVDRVFLGNPSSPLIT